MLVQQMMNTGSISGSAVNHVPLSSNPANTLSEAQLLESEEYFEQGKVFLSDLKYKEAVKAF